MDTHGSYPPARTTVERWPWKGTGMCAACYWGEAVCWRCVHRVGVASGLGRMMAIFVDVFTTFGLTISERKTENMCMPIPLAPATHIVFNATGQQHRQTTSFTYLWMAVTESLNLSDEIDRRIHAGWMRFKRYTRELYDRPKASLLPFKARMVRSEVIEALLYGCATWTPWRATTLSSVRHTIGCCFES